MPHHTLPSNPSWILPHAPPGRARDAGQDHPSARPEQLVAIGRDVERLVLARAVRLYAEDRVVLAGARTVVFG
jgi:hypothetical protein